MRNPRKLDIACPNKECRAFNKAGLLNVVRNGKQANGTQKYKCTECRRNFTRTINTPFFHKHLSKREIIRICKMLSEKCTYRAIARMTDHHLDTVRAIADAVSQHCKKFNDYFITELKLTPVEVDEMWSFVKKKKKIAKLRIAS
jgi:transposase-like protein